MCINMQQATVRPKRWLDQILKEGKPAVERYTEFLKAGSSEYPIDILKKAGVDMTSPEPIEAACKMFEEKLNEMEELLSKVNPS